MMVTPEGNEEAVYELTLVGSIGPAVMAALGPCTTAISEIQTTLGARLPEGVDLVELVLRLEMRGLTLASISAM